MVERLDQVTLDGHGPRGRAQFVLVAGNGHVSAHPVRGDAVIIGRSPECDVVIDDRALSRRHARLSLGETARLQDLGSKNGTVLGTKVLQGGEPVDLDGARGFHIGPYSLVLVSSGAAGSASSWDSRHDPERVDDPRPSAVSRFVRDVSASQVSVLILGETGVGKEVLAHTLHRLSERIGPHSRINCAALAESLLESELFGHERGAFTGASAAKMGLLESAESGTVFLDEIGEIPLSTQSKLLRAVEAREITRVGSTRTIGINTRFVAATNRDLRTEVAQGRFRADLYFRLAEVTLRIPPLRERRAMIGALALGFVAECAVRRKREDLRLSVDAMRALESYDYPGNVRELRSIIERASLLARSGVIQPAHLGLTGRELPRAPELPGPTSSAPPVPSPSAPPPSDADLAEREQIVRALEAHAGNQTRTAKALGMSRTTFVQKLRLYRVPRPRT